MSVFVIGNTYNVGTSCFYGGLALTISVYGGASARFVQFTSFLLIYLNIERAKVSLALGYEQRASDILLF